MDNLIYFLAGWGATDIALLIIFSLAKRLG